MHTAEMQVTNKEEHMKYFLINWSITFNEFHLNKFDNFNFSHRKSMKLVISEEANVYCIQRKV